MVNKLTSLILASFLGFSSINSVKADDDLENKVLIEDLYFYVMNNGSRLGLWDDESKTFLVANNKYRVFAFDLGNREFEIIDLTKNYICNWKDDRDNGHRFIPDLGSDETKCLDIARDVANQIGYDVTDLILEIRETALNPGTTRTILGGNEWSSLPVGNDEFAIFAYSDLSVDIVKLDINDPNKEIVCEYFEKDGHYQLHYNLPVAWWECSGITQEVAKRIKEMQVSSKPKLYK